MRPFVIEFSHQTAKGRETFQFDTYADDLAGAHRQADSLVKDSKWRDVRIVGITEIKDEAEDPRDKVPQWDYRIVGGVARDEPSSEEV